MLSGYRFSSKSPLDLNFSEVEGILSSRIDSLEARLASYIYSNLRVMEEGMYVDFEDVNKNVENAGKYLSRLCLEKSLLSEPFEAFYYAHKAVVYDENISPREETTLSLGSSMVVGSSGDLGFYKKNQRMLCLEKDMDDIEISSSFLAFVKTDRHLYGDFASDIYHEFHHDFYEGEKEDARRYVSWIIENIDKDDGSGRKKLKIINRDMKFFCKSVLEKRLQKKDM